jgi:hypothetical protein
VRVRVLGWFDEFETRIRQIDENEYGLNTCTAKDFPRTKNTLYVLGRNSHANCVAFAYWWYWDWNSKAGKARASRDELLAASEAAESRIRRLIWDCVTWRHSLSCPGWAALDSCSARSWVCSHPRQISIGLLTPFLVHRVYFCPSWLNWQHDPWWAAI